MTIRFRHLRLRAETSSGTFGADIPFVPGLNVLWADNTKGKSTCLQGLLYALGLEKMLSPRREIPLTYVMTSHLDEPETGTQHKILESAVFVEMENAQGEIVTVRRGIKSTTDTRLVTVFRGPLLTQPAGQYAQNDYFVLDPGAAQREAGFHRMLAGFLGWDLPRVRRFDGSETPLYLETIFPLLFVEQKSGWSSMPGAFPTYLQIRDVSRRAVEFLMALDTFGGELRRQQLDLEIAANNSAWAAKRGEIQSVAASANARVPGIPDTPTVSSADIESAFLMVPDQEEWRPIAALTAALRGRVADMKTGEIPQIGDISEDAAAELDRAMESAAEKNARRNSLFRSRQAEITQKASIRQRLAALQEDLQKNLDAQKLRNFGSRVTESFAADHCPTCFQPIHDTLLAQRASAAVMSIEDNIEYIRSQRAIFLRLDAQADAAIVDYEKQLYSSPRPRLVGPSFSRRARATYHSASSPRETGIMFTMPNPSDPPDFALKLRTRSPSCASTSNSLSLAASLASH